MHRSSAAFALVLSTLMAVHAGTPLTLVHIHGLAYSADGNQLVVATHHGLAMFSGGRWSRAAGPAHDFMGFTATRTAFYSSGHPAAGSGLPDPLGLIKSTDGGRTWTSLALEGESDFHTAAASHGKNVVYVVNRQPNSRMAATGIHYTRDEGATWHRAEARGLGGPLHYLAAHPDDDKQIAAGTDTGLYVSRDRGTSFERLAALGYVLAQRFDFDGRHIWFSSYAAGKAALTKIRLDGRGRAEELSLPALAEHDDAVAHIAQNPQLPTEIAVATFKRSVFASRDGGRTWVQSAREGMTLE
jgi:photosystem II stability/assembly factor-like uncharacterized protein